MKPESCKSPMKRQGASLKRNEGLADPNNPRQRIFGRAEQSEPEYMRAKAYGNEMKYAACPKDSKIQDSGYKESEK